MRSTMRSSTDAARPRRPGPEAALVEKIEELSALRALNDRLAGATDYGAACRALIEHVWEEHHADRVLFLSIDARRRRARVEAATPADGASPADEIALERAPLPTLLETGEPLVLLDVPAWLWSGRGRRCVVVAAPTHVRATTTGLLLACYAGGRMAGLEEDHRMLALVATSAALALDAARSGAREEFLATLRHDIGNPLDVALGHTEMLIERLAADGEGAALAVSVHESLKVVADLVTNSLHLAAIDRATPILEPEPLDVALLAAEVVERFRPAALATGLTLTAGGGAPPVTADRRQLRRVLANLVGNAVKFTPAPGQVTVTVGADPAAVTVAVTDTGSGLAPDDLSRLFAKYVRLRPEVPGTGLGLYISRAIVEAHGGTVGVTSAPGKGTTFTVRLPR